MKKHPLANCEDCPYGDKGGFVPTLNPQPRAKLAIIGEAPGAYEAAYGIPFTGPSGDLLNQVLKHHNIERDQVMITNSVLCRPEANADPPKKALAACAPRLHAEIAASGVDTIVAVGKAASNALVEQRGSMKKLRVGNGKEYKEDPSIKVISTWHPAYCLRSPDAFPDFVKDLGKVRHGPTAAWEAPQFRVFNTIDTALQAITILRNQFTQLVIDIESSHDKDSSFIHPSEWPLLCIGIAYAKGKAVVFGDIVINDPEFASAFKDLLSHSVIIAHNGKFDLSGLRALVGRQFLSFDTMLASYTRNERPGYHSLEQLGIELLGTPDWKSEIKKYIPKNGDYAGIPREVLYRYNAYDVAATWDLKEYFEAEFDEDDWKKHDLLCEAASRIVDLDNAGLTFDEEYNKELTTRFEQEIADIEEIINSIAGYPVNPRSPIQVKKYYDSQGYTLPTTEADFLREMLGKLDGETREFTEQLLHHRKRAKLFGTYVKGLAKRVYRGKVYTTFLLHGTTSGRLSSRDPNLQNVVREKYIRNQFTASSSERVLAQLDYKQAEGRVIATLAKDEYLADIFRDPNRDIFNELCNDIFGVGKWEKENRVAMKSIFYGDSYGRGVASITRELNLQGVKITESETRAFMRQFHDLTPAIRLWQTSIKQRVLNGEDLITPFGRRRSFWLITEKNKADVLNEGLSFLPQSIASDITLTALINIPEEALKEYDAEMKLTIHDALVFESPKQTVQKVADLVKREMLASARKFTSFVPFAVDFSSGFRWGEL